MRQSGIQSFFEASMPVGRLFGVPIKLHISLLFFLYPAFRMASHSGAMFAAEVVVGLILSVLLHELGHALAAKAYKLTGLSITLHGFGGFAVSKGYRTPTQALVIVLAGPAVTFLLFGIGLFLAVAGMIAFPQGTVWYEQAEIAGILAAVNLVMGIANMLPMLPFDGAQALSALLSRRLSPLAAQRRVAHIGLITGPLCLLAGIGLGEPLLSVFGIIGGLTSYSVLKSSGGIRFLEFLDDRKRRRQVAETHRREQRRHQSYLDDVEARERRRVEQERLRKLIDPPSDAG